ncbi:hypothetical protein Q5P01_013937 [Channa striata]|uniref:C-type lectin domain-containing protein n=1 Tax=Channa striata TaxID=64152 RepID=A0AA88MK90_CHASR|nr:hypothetical protein Q5P01_013937 [Channa striata]
MTEDRQKKTCPAGWTMFSFSCYFLSDSGSWTKGREDCRRTDADLVIIDSAEEQNFLSGFAKEDSWIGLSDGDTEGTWKWTDGTPLTFKNWGQYEPNNGGENGNEDCVQIRAQKGVWNDLPCGTSLKSICEK